MYAYIKGEDEHFCFQFLSTRKEAENWIESELFLYNICYKDAEYSVLTNKEFYEKFPELKNKNLYSSRRLGNKLLERIALKDKD